MIKFLTTVLLGCFVSATSGQVKSADSTHVSKSYYGAGVLGITTLGTISAGLTANAELKNRVLLSANWIGELDIRDFYDYYRNVHSFNILAGKIYKQQNSLISFSAGVGLTRVLTMDSRGAALTEVREKTLGIPLLLQAYAIAFQAVGIGVNVYGNLNLKQSTAGIQLGLALGRISTRPKR